MTEFETTAERVKALIEAAPSQARLAKAARISEGTLINWSRGLGLRNSKLDEAARNLGISPAWLREGKGRAEDALAVIQARFDLGAQSTVREDSGDARLGSVGPHGSSGPLGPLGPRAKIRRAREARKLTIAQLARLVHYPVVVLDQLENGQRGASEKLLKAIAREMPELSLEELMGGSESLPILSDDGAEATYGAEPAINLPPGMKGRNVPLLSYAQAGLWDANHSDALYDYTTVFAPDVDDRQAFAIKVSGNSMEPDMHEGDYVICSPSAALHNGEAAVIRTRSEQVFIKFWEKRSDHVTLSSANPDYKPLNFPLSEIAGAWPVVQHIKRGKVKRQHP